MAFASPHNWDAIVQDYRTGVPLDQIEAKHQIGRTGLRKGLRARGLMEAGKAQIRSRAVRKADEQSVLDAALPVNLARAEGVIEVAAGVITRHRRALYNSQVLVNTLKEQLRAAIDNRPQVEEAVIEYFGALNSLNPTQVSALRQQMNDALLAISIGSNISALKNLAAAEKSYIELERKVFNLEEEDNGEKKYEDYLREMHAKIIARQKEQKLLAQKSETVAEGN